MARQTAGYLATVIEVDCPCGNMINLRTREPSHFPKLCRQCGKHTFRVALGTGKKNYRVFRYDIYNNETDITNQSRLIAQEVKDG